jgi:hypothetical protein
MYPFLVFSKIILNIVVIKHNYLIMPILSPDIETEDVYTVTIYYFDLGSFNLIFTLIHFSSSHPYKMNKELSAIKLFIKISSTILDGRGWFGKVGKGGEAREKVEGQQYTSIFPSSMGATVHKLG